MRSMFAKVIRRRLVAAFLLLAFATGSVLFWNEGAFDLPQFAVNIVVAIAGFAWLHFRWRAQEQAALTPGKVKDIFE